MPQQVLYFDELWVGQEFMTGARIISMEDVEAFARLSGDLNPVHLDEEYAKSSAFGRRVAHGALTVAAVSGLLSPLLAESTLAAYGIDRLRFRRPVYPGESLRVVMRVAALEPIDDHSGMLKLHCRALKDNNEAALVGLFSVILKRKRTLP
ncbi:MAG: MaoC family dehydratase N-terminal domain-containing protein [Planctomycetes bacterium]|nr:MaoC family dehydratase N-terminal domain-containing protein [Planctomycetota bacterium]